jgi:hypothetical protein
MRWTRKPSPPVRLAARISFTTALVAAVALSPQPAATGAQTEGCAPPLPRCHSCPTTLGRNPRRLLPLTANAVASASTAALRRESPKERPLVVTATLATADRVRGPAARSECARRVWQRTVVVYITLRAYATSASNAPPRPAEVPRPASDGSIQSPRARQSTRARRPTGAAYRSCRPTLREDCSPNGRERSHNSRCSGSPSACAHTASTRFPTR